MSKSGAVAASTDASAFGSALLTNSESSTDVQSTAQEDAQHQVQSTAEEDAQHEVCLQLFTRLDRANKGYLTAEDCDETILSLLDSSHVGRLDFDDFCRAFQQHYAVVQPQMQQNDDQVEADTAHASNHASVDASTLPAHRSQSRSRPLSLSLSLTRPLSLSLRQSPLASSKASPRGTMLSHSGNHLLAQVNAASAAASIGASTPLLSSSLSGSSFADQHQITFTPKSNVFAATQSKTASKKCSRSATLTSALLFDELILGSHLVSKSPLQSSKTNSKNRDALQINTQSNSASPLISAHHSRVVSSATRTQFFNPSVRTKHHQRMTSTLHKSANQSRHQVDEIQSESQPGAFSAFDSNASTTDPFRASRHQLSRLDRLQRIESWCQATLSDHALKLKDSASELDTSTNNDIHSSDPSSNTDDSLLLTLSEISTTAAYVARVLNEQELTDLDSVLADEGASQGLSLVKFHRAIQECMQPMQHSQLTPVQEASGDDDESSNQHQFDSLSQSASASAPSALQLELEHDDDAFMLLFLRVLYAQIRGVRLRHSITQAPIGQTRQDFDGDAAATDTEAASNADDNHSNSSESAAASASSASLVYDESIRRLNALVQQLNSKLVRATQVTQEYERDNAIQASECQSLVEELRKQRESEEERELRCTALQQTVDRLTSQLSAQSAQLSNATRMHTVETSLSQGEQLTRHQLEAQLADYKLKFEALQSARSAAMKNEFASRQAMQDDLARQRDDRSSTSAVASSARIAQLESEVNAMRLTVKRMESEAQESERLLAALQHQHKIEAQLRFEEANRAISTKSRTSDAKSQLSESTLSIASKGSRLSVAPADQGLSADPRLSNASHLSLSDELSDLNRTSQSPSNLERIAPPDAAQSPGRSASHATNGGSARDDATSQATFDQRFALHQSEHRAIVSDFESRIAVLHSELQRSNDGLAELRLRHDQHQSAASESAAQQSRQHASDSERLSAQVDKQALQHSIVLKEQHRLLQHSNVRVEQLQSQLLQAVSDHQRVVSELNDQMRSLADRLSQAESRVSQEIGRLSFAEQQRAAAHSDAAILSQRLGAEVAASEKSTAEIIKLFAQIASLQRQIEIEQGRAARLQKQIDEHQCPILPAPGPAPASPSAANGTAAKTPPPNQVATKVQTVAASPVSDSLSPTNKHLANSTELKPSASAVNSPTANPKPNADAAASSSPQSKAPDVQIPGQPTAAKPPVASTLDSAVPTKSLGPVPPQAVASTVTSTVAAPKPSDPLIAAKTESDLAAPPLVKRVDDTVLRDLQLYLDYINSTFASKQTQPVSQLAASNSAQLAKSPTLATSVDSDQVDLACASLLPCSVKQLQRSFASGLLLCCFVAHCQPMHCEERAIQCTSNADSNQSQSANPSMSSAVGQLSPESSQEISAADFNLNLALLSAQACGVRLQHRTDFNSRPPTIDPKSAMTLAEQRKLIRQCQEPLHTEQLTSFLFGLLRAKYLLSCAFDDSTDSKQATNAAQQPAASSHNGTSPDSLAAAAGTPESKLANWLNAQLRAANAPSQDAISPGLALSQSASSAHSANHKFDSTNSFPLVDIKSISALLDLLDQQQKQQQSTSAKPTSTSANPSSRVSGPLLCQRLLDLGVGPIFSIDSLSHPTAASSLLLCSALWHRFRSSERDSAARQATISDTAEAESRVEARASKSRTAAAAAPIDSSLGAVGLEASEIALLTAWVNSLQLPNQPLVVSLCDDCSSGVLLLHVVDRLRSRTVDWSRVEQRPKRLNRFACVNNCNLLIDLCTAKLRLTLIGVGGVDICDSIIKYTLALLTQLMRYHTLNQLGESLLQQAKRRSTIQTSPNGISSLTNAKVDSGIIAPKLSVSEKEILDWANRRVESTPQSRIITSQHACHKINSFRDGHLSHSLHAIALLHSCHDQCVNWDKVAGIKSPVNSSMDQNAEFTNGKASSNSQSGGGANAGLAPKAIQSDLKLNQPAADVPSILTMSRQLKLLNARLAVGFARKLGAILFVSDSDLVNLKGSANLILYASIMQTQT